MNSKNIEIYRLFYVDQNHSTMGEEYKVACESQIMSKVTMTLNKLDPDKNQLFGIFGEKFGLETCLYSLFPGHQTQINSIFTTIDQMPAIWAVYDNMKSVFVLVSTHEIISGKQTDFMIVMQRFLQDICRNILICPSDVFFSNFSTKHSFHGKPHAGRTYRQVKKERINIQPPQKIILDDKSISEISLVEKYQNTIMTNNTSNTYHFQKIFEQPTKSTTDNRFNKLRELLQTQLDVGTLAVGSVLKFCQKCEIFLSKSQESRIEKIVSDYVGDYNKKKSEINKQSKSLVKELLSIESRFNNLFSSIDIDENLKKMLIDVVTDWLINPIHIGEHTEEFSTRITSMAYSHKSNKNSPIKIESQRLDRFIAELPSHDVKEVMRTSQESFKHAIYLAITSENQFDVHYSIQRLHFNSVNDGGNRLQCLTIGCSTPFQISMNDLGVFINISALSELDRLEFSRRVELVACFNMNDGKREAIALKCPEIISKKLTSVFVHTVLLYNNGAFRKLVDFHLPRIQMAYSSSQNSNTLVVYNIDTGSITKCLLDDFGQLQSSFILHPQDRSKKPIGVKSLALTVAQDLLIIIDSNSSVYAIDISEEDVANISLLVKNTHDYSNKVAFVASNGDLYQAVRTIGEKNPSFFFQTKSCVDIIDQNYCQMYSIEIEQHSLLYKMHVFTDFIDTYCVLFSANTTEVYYIQNLVSDTRIERQESSGNLEKSIKQYIGNQLLDVIKQGEIKFGVPDLSDETQYHFVLAPEYSAYSDRIKQYFKDLDVKAQLRIGYEEIDLINSSLNIAQLIKIVVSRVPLQLCTIDMGAILPLNNGRRDRMDHLSSISFRIEMKAREISFSYLDSILYNINEQIKIVGIIGRQSTGKSYLMNKLFRTRFNVAAGRCTDGIWMSYAFLENTHFVVLDCEGLFSDQRTEDEEIKLISFLAAVCDITILSQDLGFSRFQDRLFSALSQAVDKIGKNNKLFKGILVMAVRDISDNNADESSNAAEKKFLDLERKGKSRFLAQLFSKTFKVQLLHHFENKNFDFEVVNLRRTFLEHIMKDEMTDLPLPSRWENGQDLSDRLKILLVQLYTDNFTDSNEVHVDLKLADLEKDMKRAWTTFCLDDENTIELHKQEIEKEYENASYLLEFDHVNLELDENSSSENFDRIRKFILKQLRSINVFPEKTNEEMNKIYPFVNDLILEVMSYRRKQVERLMLERFQKQFPDENENIKERKTKFMDSIKEYMLSYKIQMCLKQCASCNLKCIKSTQHTEETKASLEEKKNELTRLQASSLIIFTENIEERIKILKKDQLAAKTKEDELHKEMVRLSDELKHLSEKEKLTAEITQNDSDLTVEKKRIDNLTQKLHDIHQQLKNLFQSEINIDELSHQLDEQVQKLVIADPYKVDDLNKLIERFHQEYETEYINKNKLLYFSPKQEHTDEAESISDSQLNTALLSKMMADNAENINNYSKFIQQCLLKIKEQLSTEQQHLKNSETQIQETEKQKVDAEKQKEEITKLIETTKIESEELNKQLSEITFEQKTLSKELDEQDQLIDTKTSFEIQNIKCYMKNLQDKLNICSKSCLDNDEIECRRKQEIAKLNFFLKERSDKEANLATWKTEINAFNDTTQVKELEQQIYKDEQAIPMILEKINNVQNKIRSIEEEQQTSSYNQQNAKQLLNEEIKEAKQLIETIHSYDQRIERTRAQLSGASKKRDKKEEDIKKLKDEDPEDEDIKEQEKLLEKQLKKHNETITDVQVTLANIIQEKISACNNSILLKKISNDPQYDIYEQQKNKQNRRTELSERLKTLNEDIERLQNSLSHEEDRLKGQNQEILNINENFNLQKVKYNIHLKNVQSDKEWNEVGIELLQLINEIEASLTTASKELNEIFEAQVLIKERMSLCDALILANNEQKRLDALLKTLIQQLDAKNDNTFTCRYASAQECQEQYDIIARDYDDAYSQTKKIEQELSDMDIYSQLNDEIRNLERETQTHCDCATDHTCSGICQICLKEDETIQNKCTLVAGHGGDHICNEGHICLKLCQICEKYGFSNNRCVFRYEHTEPTYHQCERTHQCKKTCVCSDPCVIPQEIEQHNFHRCNKKDCWKPCMFSCGKQCATQDHNHDANAETVPVVIGDDIHQLKKHLCDQPHYCKGNCKKSGVCKLEYKEILMDYISKSCITFPYIHVEVKAVRDACKEKIDVGKISHNESSSLHCDCKNVHSCPERCPDCDAFCSENFGHKGNHKSNHRNKDEHIFTSTNPTERIEILSTEQEKIHTRVYKVGESAKPENCSTSCKRRSRSHFHLIECPGGSECREKILGNKAKHSNDTYYYDSGKPSGINYDKVLCSVYWSLHNWNSPVSDVDHQKLVDSCSIYCDKHIERDKSGHILKECTKGFCTLSAWHTGDHVLQCESDHGSLKTYQGVDICFVIDSTRSMKLYFEKVKQTITCIIKNNQELMKKLGKSSSDFRFAIVDYRDHLPQADYVFQTCDFTTDSLASAYVENLKTGSGGDFPEAVLDGLDAACALTWRDRTDRLLFHVLDAPPHGTTYHTYRKNDKWPDGCPCGKTAAGVLSVMKKKNIVYHVVPCSSYLNMMITEFKNHIEVKTLTFGDKSTFEDVITKQVCQQLIDTEITLKKT